MLKQLLSQLFRRASAGDRAAAMLGAESDGLLIKAQRCIDIGDIEFARRHLERAVAVDPAHAGALYELGCLAAQAGRTEAAAGFFARAIAADPRSARSYNACGNLHFSRGDLDEAARMYREAIRVEPHLAQAYANMGMVLCEQGDQEAGLGFLERATELDPMLSEAHNAIGIALASQGDAERGITAMRRAAQLRPDSHDIHSNLIMTLGFDARNGPAEHYEERRLWQKRHVEPLRLPPREHVNRPDPGRRLRIGYVSADFRQHAAAYTFGPMLLHYDRDNFEVACYSNSTQEDAFTARFRGAVDRWRNICAAPDAEAEQLILRDGIDILVDLSGHTLGNRLLLFARKPAPIQVTAWGGVTGTGLDAMDYIFGDTVLIPQTMSRYFREKVIHLPCAQTYMPQAELPPVKRLPASGRGFVTFGYFNNYIKLSSASLDLWARLLGVLPSSQMVFKAKEFDRPQPRARVVEAFGRAGISAERLIFRGRTSWYEHLDAHGDVDVVLDPFPIVGGISALEALSMGTPVVVLEGVAAPNRISASILAAVGMEAWIARSPDHYLSIAVERAQDISGLETLRHSLRGRLMASAAGDPVGYARAVESVYRALWRNWCDERRR